MKQVFSVTRRSRTDVSHLYTDWVSVIIDFTDVTLVIEDTYGGEDKEDEKDEGDEEDEGDEKDEGDEEDEENDYFAICITLLVL